MFPVSMVSLIRRILVCRHQDPVPRRGDDADARNEEGERQTPDFVPSPLPSPCIHASGGNGSAVNPIVSKPSALFIFRSGLILEDSFGWGVDEPSFFPKRRTSLVVRGCWGQPDKTTLRGIMKLWNISPLHFHRCFADRILGSPVFTIPSSPPPLPSSRSSGACPRPCKRWRGPRRKSTSRPSSWTISLRPSPRTAPPSAPTGRPRNGGDLVLECLTSKLRMWRLREFMRNVWGMEKRDTPTLPNTCFWDANVILQKTHIICSNRSKKGARWQCFGG